MLERHMNCAATSFRVFQIDRDLCAKSPARARARARERFPCSWAGSGWFESITIQSFPFCFYARLRKFIDS
jgi:hypothetical protein